MKIFKKILIANRGEIAVRIIKSAKKLGIKSVAVYSEVDSHSLHVKLADEAYCIGKQDLSQTYLDVDKIIDIAVSHKCEAIHPGYGFLAESPLLVKACNIAGITFIGPDMKSISLMGNKIEARKFVKETGVPVTEGVTGNIDELLKKSSDIEFPILVKAAAGGGGKGMRIVNENDSLADIIESTSREAKNYFGDGTIYIEKYVENPRHIEVQVLGDNEGNVIHLFERECTIQRRYQKIIEESPSPTLTTEIREKICKAAVKIAKSVGYNSAGTVEFLVDNKLNFYFLEMNTRIQVEHPVTEMVTGIDLVDEQILIAAGNPLRYLQSEITQRGHAIESRIYAEDPENNFMPSPGDISLLVFPDGDNIRLDTGIENETTIHSFFDPMICKLIVYGSTRKSVIEKSVKALEQTVIHGIKTNIPFLISILEHKAFTDNMISTKFCDENVKSIISGIEKRKEEMGLEVPLICLTLEHIAANPKPKNVWEQIGYWRNNMVLNFEVEQNSNSVEVVSKSSKHHLISITGKDFPVSLLSIDHNSIHFEHDGKKQKAHISNSNNNETTLTINGSTFSIKNKNKLGSTNGYFSHSEAEKGSLFSPMPGKVIKINVNKGDDVVRGTILLVVEAMKMENNIIASKDSVVEKVNVKEGQMVDTDVQLVVLKK